MVNNREKNFTPHKLDQRMRQVDESIERYRSALETIDRTEPTEAETKTGHLKEKPKKLNRQTRQLREIEVELKCRPDEQLSLRPRRSIDGHQRPWYRHRWPQRSSVADAKHHPIVAHEANNTGHDRDQRSNMAMQRRQR